MAVTRWTPCAPPRRWFPPHCSGHRPPPTRHTPGKPRKKAPSPYTSYSSLRTRRLSAPHNWCTHQHRLEALDHQPLLRGKQLWPEDLPLVPPGTTQWDLDLGAFASSHVPAFANLLCWKLEWGAWHKREKNQDSKSWAKIGNKILNPKHVCFKSHGFPTPTSHVPCEIIVSHPTISIRCSWMGSNETWNRWNISTLLGNLWANHGTPYLGILSTKFCLGFELTSLASNIEMLTMFHVPQKWIHKKMAPS